MDNGAPRPFSYAWLQKNLDASGSYVLRDDDGTESTADRTGTSLTALARAVGLDPASVTFTEVIDLKGRFLPLDSGELGPAAYEDGLVPLVYDSGDSLTYLRPLRSDDDANNSTDPNKLGNVRTFDDGALELTFHTTGALLHPEIHADRTSVDAGDSVNFTATVPGLVGAATYEWSFGPVTNVPTASAKWCKTGSATVTVTSGDSKGRSEPLTIDADGSECPTSTPTISTTVTPTSTLSASATATPTETATATSTPTVGPIDAATPTVGPTPTATGAATGVETGGPTATSTPSAAATQTGGTIRGTLLLAAGAAAPPAVVVPSEQSSTPMADPPQVDTHDRLTLPRWLLGVGALALFAAAGLVGELRPRWWQRLRATGRMQP